MPTANLWYRSVPRVELDQRAREARLRLEHLERLVPRAAATGSWLRRVLCLVSVRPFGKGDQSNRRPERVSEIDQGSIIPSAA
jgi:hypothetical protein